MHSHTSLFLRVALIGAFAALAAFAVVGGLPAHAADITVNTTNDELNADGDCSLREAIEAANTDAAVDACTAGSGPDTVTVPAGTYVISLAGDENLNATGDYDILEGVAIDGAGAGATIVDGGGLDRVFDIINASDTVVISGVTIRNGAASGDGGGISSDGTLTIADSTISGNSADSSDGGGISSSGSLTVTNSTISGNSAGTSGGIYFCAGGADAATISDTTISGNTTPGEGGAIWHECGSTMTITDSTLSGNSSTNDNGGGINNEEELVIDNTAISGNTADDDGGGIYSFGDVTITNSTLSGNTAFGGGGMKNESTVSMTNVTISGNTADTSDGGGLSTDDTATLTNVTITANTAAATGDGIYNENGTATLKNTIVAGNGAGNCGGDPVTSVGNNLDGDGSCGPAAVGDISNTDPTLGPLADNGGSTQTHALLAGSPAIDTGDNAACTGTDQRGVARPVDGDENGTATCDIGAYEFEPVSEPTPTPTSAPTPTPAGLPVTGASPADEGVSGLALAAAAAAAIILGALITATYALAKRQHQ